jgi:cation:H+ antiporter
VSLAVFAAGALITMVLGVRLARAGDELADRTGMGEALFGSVFFGGMISLSGLVMTATASANGHASLAYSNAVGGIAAQLLALAVADMAYRRANLEHAAASMQSAMFAVLLACLICIALAASFTPELTFWSIHPMSPALVVAYLFGLKLVNQAKADPQWKPNLTKETVPDEPEPRSGRSTRRIWVDFVFSGLVVAVSGWGIARAAAAVVEHTGLSASFVGAVLMGLINAIPEAVTAVAAVRAGALTLAIGGVLGGSSFDVLNLALGDVAYRKGSLYHAANSDDLLVNASALLMTLILLAGLLRREKQGPLGIGFEGVALGVVYALMLAVTAF